MNKLTPLALTLIIASINLPSKATSYMDQRALYKYDQALAAGCPKVEQKSAKLAGTLGLLPGGASFYTGNIGLGLLGVLFWPFSAAWEIPSGAMKAVQRNKIATVANCEDLGKIKI